MIDFSLIPEITVPHMKGGEGYAKGRAFIDENVRIQKSILDPGCSIGNHVHEDNYEIVYILEGEATCLLDGKTEIVKAGQVHYCPKGHSHSMKNNGKAPLKCLCIVPKQP